MKTMLNALNPQTKQIPLLSDSFPLTHCPKCEGDFEAPVVRCVGEGFHFVHQCKKCSSSFALVPVTTLGLYELQSRHWHKSEALPV